MKITKHIYFLSALLFSCSLFLSCRDEKLVEPEDPAQTEAEGEYLTFTINLQSMQSRDGSIGSDNFEDFEDYINSEMFYILFFDVNNKLIRKFGPDDLSLIPAIDKNTGYTKNWYVRIPLSKLPNGETFADKLRSESFKIAVLANWSTMPVIRESSVDSEGNYIPGDDIDVLHHNPNETTVDPVYQYLYPGTAPKRGYFTDWVQSNSPANGFDFSSKEKARETIRQKWDPALSENVVEDPTNATEEDYQYRKFTDLWFLWNFGGAADDNALPYGTCILSLDDESKNGYVFTDDKKSAWETRNGLNLRTWITGGNENFTGERDLSDLNNSDLNYLKFKTKTTAKAVVEKIGNLKYYGVKLPKIVSQSETGRSYNRVNDENDDAIFSFIARATGTLFITAKSVNGNTCKITAQVGYTQTTEDFKFGGQIQTIEKKINITGDEKRVYIYNNSSGNEDVIIYQIEYVQDEYIYAADRSGIKPSADYPIAMYGIQSFSELGPVWAKGTSFDLSNYDGTGSSWNVTNGYSTIPLLRSVAKIELKIPISSFQERFVYLRCANRKARWEPVDLKTNTKEVWKDITSSGNHPADCEWFTIKNQPPFYGSPEGTTYESKLAWYYGSWLGNDPNGNYPKIMNALIDRSDFVEFIPAGSDGIYNRYVLYIGEKYVDDPNTKGDITANPKVCHIEFRLKDDPYTNLDDNECYRIYFIEGGVKDDAYIPEFNPAGRNGQDDDWEHQYEQDADILADHWPIMRNHVYSFTLQDIDHLLVVVNLKVLPWKKAEDNNIYDW